MNPLSMALMARRPGVPPPWAPPMPAPPAFDLGRFRGPAMPMPPPPGNVPQFAYGTRLMGTPSIGPGGSGNGTRLMGTPSIGPNGLGGGPPAPSSAPLDPRYNVIPPSRPGGMFGGNVPRFAYGTGMDYYDPNQGNPMGGRPSAIYATGGMGGAPRGDASGRGANPDIPGAGMFSGDKGAGGKDAGPPAPQGGPYTTMPLNPQPIGGSGNGGGGPVSFTPVPGIGTDTSPYAMSGAGNPDAFGNYRRFGPGGQGGIGGAMRQIFGGGFDSGGEGVGETPTDYYRATQPLGLPGEYQGLLGQLAPYATPTTNPQTGTSGPYYPPGFGPQAPAPSVVTQGNGGTFMTAPDGSTVSAPAGAPVGASWTEQGGWTPPPYTGGGGGGAGGQGGAGGGGVTNPGGFGVLSYGGSTWQDNPALRYIKGLMSQGQYDTTGSAGSTIPGLSDASGDVTLPAPNQMNYGQLLHLQQTAPGAFDLLRSLFKAANRDLDYEMALSGGAAPLGSAYESSLVQT